VLYEHAVRDAPSTSCRADACQFVDRTCDGHLAWPLSDREPHLLETVRPGVFAAGDVRSGASNPWREPSATAPWSSASRTTPRPRSRPLGADVHVAFTRRTYDRLVRSKGRIADGLLVVFLVCLALTTAAQVRHNLAAGPHGRAPHDRPVATRTLAR
jgi:hypothetical protein